MTTIDVNLTLGELVSERSARARIFERHGLDYCCHGDRSLSEAADAAGLELDGLAAELAAVERGDGDLAAKLPPAILIDHIVETHHAYLHEELPLVEALADKVESVHGGRHPELVTVATLVRAVRDELDPHLATEEAEVFPAIRRHLDEGADLDRGVLDKLRAEHEEVGALLAELRRTTDDYALPADACASYQALYGRLAELEADTFRHVHLENNVLFPALDG